MRMLRNKTVFSFKLNQSTKNLTYNLLGGPLYTTYPSTQKDIYYIRLLGQTAQHHQNPLVRLQIGIDFRLHILPS